jgi:hypothetical protein
MGEDGAKANCVHLPSSVSNSEQLTIFILIGSITPWFLVALIPIFAIFGAVQAYLRPASNRQSAGTASTPAVGRVHPIPWGNAWTCFTCDSCETVPASSARRAVRSSARHLGPSL